MVNNVCIFLYGKPTAELWSHIGSHDVTCHLNPSQTGQYLICLPRRDERLSWSLNRDLVLWEDDVDIYCKSATYRSVSLHHSGYNVCSGKKWSAVLSVWFVVTCVMLCCNVLDDFVFAGRLGEGDLSSFSEVPTYPRWQVCRICYNEPAGDSDFVEYSLLACPSFEHFIVLNI